MSPAGWIDLIPNFPLPDGIRLREEVDFIYVYRGDKVVSICSAGISREGLRIAVKLAAEATHEHQADERGLDSRSPTR